MAPTERSNGTHTERATTEISVGCISGSPNFSFLQFAPELTGPDIFLWVFFFEVTDLCLRAQDSWSPQREFPPRM